ncbi:MAG: lactate racemase domain-containing protein, partial [Candidatus Lokiarchaeota archaeon]|nr:lactate racemase domain-containing protein [Candidatus Lokiarchaeota archaeon]
MENVKLIKVYQKFDNKKINNIAEVISNEFKRIQLDRKIMPGMKVGITVGSRGIDNLQLIIKSIIYEIKKRKGIPFILTAMGSHGGATAEGQKDILTNYGITEESMGVSIKASMETVELDQLKNGLPVYFDKIAYNADGIIVVNRVKVHTAYKAEIESGLHKMLSVGLGNHQGAKLVHSLGVKGIRDYMVEFAKVILKKAPILAGFGILENGYDQTLKIVAARPEELGRVDKELLRECKQILPKLPVKNIDILIIQEMGKNISGTGMDTNVIGGIKDFKAG